MMSIRNQFEDYKRSGTANNITVGVLAVMGMLCGAKSFTGTQIARVEYCFQPNDSPNFCTPDKRYVMPESEFNAQTYTPSNPEFQRESFLPAKATPLRIIEPSNPNKHWWGIAATGLMGSAYGLSKAREKRLIHIMPEYREQTRTDWLISKLWHGLRLHKQAYSAQLDYEFHQWTENRRARVAQLSSMSPQELAIYQQQVRLQAQAEAQLQLQAISKQAQLTGQSLDDLTRSDDKMTGSEQQALASPDSWVQNLIKQTCLIWGNQGGGKSWLARHVTLMKKQAGYRVIVLDPDSNKAEWKGVNSYHSWSDIEAQIRAYVSEIEDRLNTFNNSTFSEDEWRAKLWAEGQATALICEEVTTYGDFIKDEELLSKFGKLALTKSRKQEMPVTIVAHNNTTTCLFGIKGLYNLVSKMLQVECLAQVDPVTLQPKSTGQAKVKLDSSNDWLEVKLPKLDAKITDFCSTDERLSHDRDYINRVYNLEFDLGDIPDNSTDNTSHQLSDMATKLLDYLTRTERMTADVKEFKSNFKVNGERFTVEQIKGWMYEIVGAGKADWVAPGVIKLNQI
jgi:hypothetical protein